MDKNKCTSCGKPKCSCKNKEFTKAVIEIDNPEQITLIRRVVIPASMGDDTAVPPVVGKYHNVLLYYEANGKSYLYSSDGVPTLLANGLTDYEQAVNLPQINGVTLTGDKTSAELGLQSALTAGDGIEIENDTISISDIEQYAHFFDTVADMKAATNLVAGDYAKTLGFYTVNDGGGALYKITNTGTANEMDVIAVDSLRANLVKSSNMAPEMYGAYGDGTHDDSDYIQRCFDENSVVYMTKTYLVTKQLSFNGHISGNMVGKIISNPTQRFSGFYVYSTTSLSVDGLYFDCASNVEFAIGDKFLDFNGAIYALGSLSVSNCEFHNLYDKFIKVSGNAVKEVSIHDNLFSSDNKTNVYMAECLELSSIINQKSIINISRNTLNGFEYEYVDTYDNDSNINANGITLANVRVKELNIDSNTFNHLGRYGSIVGNNGYSRLCAIDCYFNVTPVKITNNNIINCHWSAIRLHGTSDAIVSNNLITVARACSEALIIISDAYNSAGDNPVGCDNVTISNNKIRNDNLVFAQGIYVNSYTDASIAGQDGFYGHVDNLTILGNDINFCCKAFFMFDYSLKRLNLSENFMNSEFSSISGIGTPNFLTYDTRAVMKTASTGKDFSNTILKISNNHLTLDGAVISLRQTDATLATIFADMRGTLDNNVLQNTGVGYVVYGPENANFNIFRNTINGNVGGVWNANKALNNVIFYASNSAATYNVTTDQNNSKYTN